MKPLNCVHFTDLHLGAEGQISRYPDIINLLKKDLEKQAKKYQLEYHLVLFSGDLVYSGQAEQYTTLTKYLIDLWSFFRKELNCSLLFLCVPGNHDMSRTDKTDPNVYTLKNAYFEDLGISKCVWDPKSDYHKFIKCRFSNYTKWHDELYDALDIKKRPNYYKSGFLPGDFSVRIEINEIKLGVVGLNSSFLHLSDEKNNELDINEKQLAYVCESDAGKWCAQSDMNLLMTHHGKDWLHSDSLETYNSFIYPPGRFFAHIFGHAHQSLIRDERINGNQAKRNVQGKSL